MDLDFHVTIGQRLLSDRNPACAILARHKTLSESDVKVCLFPWQLIGSGIVVRQTDFEVTIEQCVLSGRNPACAVLTKPMSLSESDVKVCLLPWHLIGSGIVVRQTDIEVTIE